MKEHAAVDLVLQPRITGQRPIARVARPAGVPIAQDDVGSRVEDNFLVTAGGVEKLSSFPDGVVRCPS